MSPLSIPRTHEVVATRPLGASVRWLSNEQEFWDGKLIWTYDVVAGTVELIAIDPRSDADRAPARDRQGTGT